MTIGRQGPRFSLLTRIIAIVVVVGLPLVAYLLQKPASRGESGGLDLKAGGGVWFCSEGSTDSGVNESIDIANPASKPAKGRYTLFVGDSRLESQQLTIPDRSDTTIDLDKELARWDPGHQIGLVVELDLTEVAVVQTVSVTTPDVTGTMAAACAMGTSASRYFASGTSLRGADTYLLLFNPFPQDAVVNVDVFTQNGIERPKNLQQFPLFAGRSAVVKMSEELRRKSTLGAVVGAEVGQVVSQQMIFSNGERIPAGAALSSGSASPSSEWYFADGNTDLKQMLWLMNTGDSEDDVVVEFFPEGPVTTTLTPQVARVSARSETTLTISPNLPSGVNFGYVVRSRRGSGLVADRMLGYPTPPGHGLTVGPGLVSPLSRWVLPGVWGASAGSRYSNVISVVNPGSTRATLTMGRLETDAVVVPPALREVVIEPGSRKTLPVSEEFPGRKAFSLVGWSDRPLVVEARISAIAPRVGFEVLAPSTFSDPIPSIVSERPNTDAISPTVTPEGGEITPQISEQ